MSSAAPRALQHHPSRGLVFCPSPRCPRKTLPNAKPREPSPGRQAAIAKPREETHLRILRGGVEPGGEAEWTRGADGVSPAARHDHSCLAPLLNREDPLGPITRSLASERPQRAETHETPRDEPGNVSDVLTARGPYPAPLRVGNEFQRTSPQQRWTTYANETPGTSPEHPLDPAAARARDKRALASMSPAGREKLLWTRDGSLIRRDVERNRVETDSDQREFGSDLDQGAPVGALSPE